MLTMITIIAIGIMAGLLIGILPGVGHPMLMLIAFSFLMVLPPELALIFYITSVQASEFSGSVSALSFGLLGEVTSQPALSERPIVASHQSLDTALRYTAIASVIGCLFVMIPFPFLLEWFREQPFMMKTSTVTVFACLVFLSVLLWKENKFITNLLLLTAGLVMSQIGFDSNGGGSTEKHFLTFGMSFLFDGIPTITVISSFIAMHAWYQYRQISTAGFQTFERKPPSVPFPWVSSLRGTAVGTIVGLIPMVGSILSSNIAHAMETRYHPGTDLKSSLSRLTAAEAANNSSFISVMIPLLVFGLAIIPSQMVLTTYLEIKAWTPAYLDSWQLSGIGFYGWISLALAISAVVSYFFCYIIVRPFAEFLCRHLSLLNIITFTVMFGTVIYAGMQAMNIVFFIFCFLLFSLIAWKYRSISFIPLVAGFLLGEQTVENFYILMRLYF